MIRKDVKMLDQRNELDSNGINGANDDDNQGPGVENLLSDDKLKEEFISSDTNSSRKSSRDRRPANIFFVGLTGTGKTSIGWALSKEIGWGFLDLDQLIEKMNGRTISKIFSQDGEPAFEIVELQAVKSLTGLRNHVVSLGGGTVMRDKNWELIKAMGMTVWIKGSPVQVAKRLSNNSTELEKRPLLARFSEIDDPDERYQKVKNEIENMLAVRSSRYSECDFEIDLSHAAVDSSVKQVKELLRSQGVFRD